MDRTDRCELLTQLSDEELARLAALVIDGSLGAVTLITPPTLGMVMARAIEGARGEVFNVGEVLVTECLVSVAGHEGWCMLLGSRPEGAVAAASVDASLEAGHPGRTQVEAELLAYAAARDAAALVERDRLAASRVQFETQ